MTGTGIAGNGPVRAFVTVAIATGAFATALWFRSDGNVWVATSIAAVVSLVAAAFTLGRDRLRLLVSGRHRSAWWGALAGLAMAAVTHLGYAVVARLVPAVRSEVIELYGSLHDRPGPVAALPLIVVVVVAEELVWRGVAHEWLSRRMAPAAVVVAQTALYAVPQLASHSALLPLVAIYGGLLWGAARVASRDLVAPTAMHLVWDVVLFVLIPLETYPPG